MNPVDDHSGVFWPEGWLFTRPVFRNRKFPLFSLLANESDHLAVQYEYSPDEELMIYGKFNRSHHTLRPCRASCRALAEETGESMTEILEKAIEAYRKQRFLDGLNADFAALRKNRAAWEQEPAERKDWDATLSDGLED